VTAVLAERLGPPTCSCGWVEKWPMPHIAENGGGIVRTCRETPVQGCRTKRAGRAKDFENVMAPLAS
jgi:hypothetical protein